MYKPIPHFLNIFSNFITTNIPAPAMLDQFVVTMFGWLSSYLVRKQAADAVGCERLMGTYVKKMPSVVYRFEKKQATFKTWPVPAPHLIN
jgi:hypothetical protein